MFLWLLGVTRCNYIYRNNKNITAWGNMLGQIFIYINLQRYINSCTQLFPKRSNNKVAEGK